MKAILKQTGSCESYDGTRLYYEVRGEGFPIVMCYGIGCLMNHWTHQIKHFSRSYKVITFDYRAHHKSDMPQDRSKLSIDSLAQDVEALMTHLNIEQASLWGHSFGAQVAIRFFDMFPQRVHSLVFINGFATNPIDGMFGNDLPNSVFHLIKTGYSTLPETISYLWRVSLNNPLAIHLSALAGGFNLHLTSLKDIEIYARGISSMDLDAFLRLFEHMMKYDGDSVLERINVPCLVIGGAKDSVTPRKFQEALHRKIKGSQFLMVPYGSHCTQLDMPELVNLKIDHFLSGILKTNRPLDDHPKADRSV